MIRDFKQTKKTLDVQFTWHGALIKFGRSWRCFALQLLLPFSNSVQIFVSLRHMLPSDLEEPVLSG